MNLVCIDKRNNKMIMSQLGGDTHPDPEIDDVQYSEKNLGIMRQNGIDAGIPEEFVEAKWLSDAEFQILLLAQIESEKTYADRRRAEYPPIEDYIDGIVKGDTEQVQKYISQCLAVKAKYPKDNL